MSHVQKCIRDALVADHSDHTNYWSLRSVLYIRHIIKFSKKNINFCEF